MQSMLGDPRPSKLGLIETCPTVQALLLCRCLPCLAKQRSVQVLALFSQAAERCCRDRLRAQTHARSTLLRLHFCLRMRPLRTAHCCSLYHKGSSYRTPAALMMHEYTKIMQSSAS